MQVKGNANQNQTSIASMLIENLALIVLKSRLSKYRQVEVTVDASDLDVLRGKVNGCTVRGTDWASPMSLTSRFLHFSLGQASIDYGALMMERRIELLNPKPEGKAIISFNSDDFGNFLKHPLFRAAAKNSVQNGPFQFHGSSVKLKDDSVVFSGSWSNETYDVCLMPNYKDQEEEMSWGSEPRVKLSAKGRGSEENNELVSLELSKFFIDLCMDLQGIQIRFSSLDIIKRGQDLLLEMKLTTKLINVPPLDVKF